MKKFTQVLLVSTVFVTAAHTAAAVESVTLTSMIPASPAYRLHSEQVDYAFKYTTSNPGGVLIFGIPYTKGTPSPNYAHGGSPLYPVGNGSGSGYFRITTGDVRVNQLYLYMTTPDQSKKLFETYIDIDYRYVDYNIRNVQITPASPATLAPGDRINISFDYSSKEDNVLIFARPFTNGSLTPGYAAHSSPYYPAGHGSGTAWFEILNPNLHVDAVGFEIRKLSPEVIYYTDYVPVSFNFCDGQCIWRVDRDAPGNNTGQNWTHAFNYLQDALRVAKSGDQIWIAEGTYYPDEDLAHPGGTNDRAATFALVEGVEVYGGFNGTEGDLSERNWLMNETVLSGNINTSGDADNSYHVVTSDVSFAVLDGFTITEGHAEGPYPQYIGAGLYIDSGEPFIRNCKFIGNQAGGGGGLASWGTGQPQIISCLFINNSSTGAGGAVSLQRSGALFRGCMFIGNTSGSGGGLYSLNNLSRPELYNCVFSGNTSTEDGGAIHQSGVGGTDNPFPPALYNCTLANNSADGQGGGIFNRGTTAISLNSCILWGNTDSGGSGQGSQFSTTVTSLSIQYSCLQGWNGTWPGPGNIGLFPLFVDADGIDDMIGTEDDNYRLIIGSPCINTGDPAPAMNDADGSRNDMGAYGGPWADLTVGPGTIPGSGYVFTTIGDLPSAFITQSAADPAKLQGTANVSGTDAANYHIPAYANSPFGSSLRIRGLFGSDDDVDYYKVQAAKWPDESTPPVEGDFEDLIDPLYKTYYYYEPLISEWVSVSVKIGPQTVSGQTNAYSYTSTGFWSHLDVRMVWNTRNRPNGKYTLRIKGYDFAGGSLTDVTPGNAQELIVLVDNSPVTAVIHNVKYGPSSPYYNPFTDWEILECGIASLQSAQENLRFTVTALHPGGHLRSFSLDAIAGKNEYRGTIVTQSYNPAMGSLWPGVTEQEFSSEDSLPPAGNLQDWKRCAYQFRLRAWANVTNGYHYIYWQTFSDHYFIDLGGLTACERADIDGSGTVDILDLAELARYWLKTCHAVP